MSKKAYWQTRLAPKGIELYERVAGQKGEWFEKIMAAEAAVLEPTGIRPFRLAEATINQEGAIRTYMAQLGKEDLRGMHMWLKAREITYYDLLRKVSP